MPYCLATICKAAFGIVNTTIFHPSAKSEINTGRAVSYDPQGIAFGYNEESFVGAG